MNSASPTITFTAITNNYNGIVANGASNPVVNYCDIDLNTVWGINNVNKSFTINAENNWWGSNTGPTHSANLGGTGQAVTDGVDYLPFGIQSAQDPLSGDVSLNGQIQAFDASQILKWIADPITYPLNALQQQVADVSGDGSIFAFDASLILQYVAGKIGIFPVEFQRKVHPATPVPPLAMYKSATVGSVSISEGLVDRGKQVTVMLSAQGIKNMFSTDIELSYNKEQLTPVSVTSTGVATGALMATSIRDGIIRIELASADALVGDGDLFQITFEASDGLKGNSKSPITFTKFNINDLDMRSQTSSAFVEVKGMPLSFALNQNYPNPFNPSTTISYQVPNNGQNVRIDVYNVVGQLVRTLVDATQNAGEYKVVWDGTSGQGQQVNTGVYLFRMTSGSFVNVKKMVFMK